jgi:hypothetical protein
MVLVNHYANTATAPVFKAADHTAVTVNLYVTTRTYNVSRKQNREVHNRTDRNVAIHRKKDAVRRDVLRLSGASSALRRHFHSQVQGKPRSTLHCGVVLALRLLRNRLFLACLGCHESIEPFSRIFQTQRQRTPRNQVCKVTEVMERKGANCLWMRGLEGIYEIRSRLRERFDTGTKLLPVLALGIKPRRDTPPKTWSLQ